MKYLIIVIAFTFFSIVSNAQKTDSTRKDTIAVLTLQQVNEITSFMTAQAGGKVDVKPETWNDIIQIMYKSIRVIEVPNKEKPKR